MDLKPIPKAWSMTLFDSTELSTYICPGSTVDVEALLTKRSAVIAQHLPPPSHLPESLGLEELSMV